MIQGHVPEEMPTSIAEIRLKTDVLLKEIAASLRGKRIEVEQVFDGEKIFFKEKTYDIGEPLMNNKGIQNVLMFLQSIVNPATVQGYIENHRRLDVFLQNVHYNLNWNLMNNYYKWEIIDYDMVIDTIMAQLELFVSRTVDNLERESYTPTIRSYETLKTAGAEEKNNILPFFSKGGKYK